MDKIIYLCGNNGTDTRVSKEIKSLVKKYSVLFIGIKDKNSVKFQNTDTKLFRGSHKNLITILLINIYLFCLLFSNKKFKKIHVVDEQFYFFFIPVLLLYKSHITLDIFDSFFLKKNINGNKLLLIKKIIYGTVNRIIVTDSNRFNLLPSFAKHKTIIIPNVPFKNYFYKSQKPKIKNKLTISYFGTLHKDRGSSFIDGILSKGYDIKILMAGWISDAYTQNLVSKYPDLINNLGLITQQEANKIIYEKAHYILCIYPANNLNNIYASPNKIYDAIQTKTPVIMNSEIIASKFVINNNLGFVFDNCKPDYHLIYSQLINRKYRIDNNLIKKYIWENYEEQLY